MGYVLQGKRGRTAEMVNNMEGLTKNQIMQYTGNNLEDVSKFVGQDLKQSALGSIIIKTAFGKREVWPQDYIIKRTPIELRFNETIYSGVVSIHVVDPSMGEELIKFWNQ
jgi:hypothetical protein